MSEMEGESIRNLDVRNRDAMFPKDHITASDLANPNGAGYISLVLKIRDIRLTEKKEAQEMGGKKKKKFIMYFEGAKKYLFLSPEVYAGAESALGPKPADWIGKEIELYVLLNRNVPKNASNPTGKKDVPRLRAAKASGKSKEPPKSEPEPSQGQTEGEQSTLENLITQADEKKESKAVTYDPKTDDKEIPF